jgi:hypothetical protein
MMAVNIGACQGESSRSSWQGSRIGDRRELRTHAVVGDHGDNFQWIRQRKFRADGLELAIARASFVTNPKGGWIYFRIAHGTVSICL